MNFAFAGCSRTAFVSCLLGSAQTLAQNAYITNATSDTVSVINTTTDAVTAMIPVGSFPVGGEPFGVAVSPDGSRVYVAHDIGPGIVSVIDTATNAVSATIPVVGNPIGIAVSPDGSRVYVTNNRSPGTVLVIDTTSNAVTAIVPGGSFPFGVAVTPDGGKVYFTNRVPTPRR
jgi:YVTN family beta-propeller protein